MLLSFPKVTLLSENICVSDGAKPEKNAESRSLLSPKLKSPIEAFQRAGTAIALGGQPNQIDLLTSMSSEPTKIIFANAVSGEINGIQVSSSQMTQDIDICIDLSPENLDRLKDAVGSLNPTHRMGSRNLPFDEEASSLYAFKNIYLNTDYGQLDCLGEIAGIGNYDQAVDNSLAIAIDGRDYNFLTLEALIKAKEAVNRPRDKESIIILKALLDKTNDGTV